MGPGTGLVCVVMVHEHLELGEKSLLVNSSLAPTAGPGKGAEVSV